MKKTLFPLLFFFFSLLFFVDASSSDDEAFLANLPEEIQTALEEQSALDFGSLLQQREIAGEETAYPRGEVQEIQKRLQEEEWVEVIVWLKDNEFTASSYQDNIEKKREEVKKIIGDVLKDLNDNDFKVKYQYFITNGFAGSVSKFGFEKLIKNKDVKEIYLDGNVYATLTQSRPLIKADEAENNLGITGKGVTVCVLDTGVDYTHQNLGGCFGPNCKVVMGYDFCNGHAEGQEPPLKTCAGQSDPDPMDEHGHGTHVAGTVASNHNNYRGIAPDAKIGALKVLNASGAGTYGAIAAGIDYCVDNAQKFNVKVITMSLGDGEPYNTTSPCPTLIDTSINKAIAAGIFVDAASGNDAFTNGLSYPACAPGVTSVGAVYDAFVGPIITRSCTDLITSEDKIACFTNRDKNLDILAPGSVITATSSSKGDSCGAPNKDGFGSCTGTSMAAPHVAGAAALLFEANQSLKPAEVENFLKLTGKILFDKETSLTFPRVDAFRATRVIWQGGTPLRSCGTISKPGNYYLENSVSSSETCFIIKANNVDIDCKDKSITYSNDHKGIEGGNIESLSVKNCRIVQPSPTDSLWAAALYLTNVSVAFFGNNTFFTRNDSSIYADPIRIHDSSNIAFINNVMDGAAIYAWRVDNGIISSNKFEGQNGISLFGFNNTIEKNKIFINRRYDGWRSTAIEISGEKNSVVSNAISNTKIKTNTDNNGIIIGGIGWLGVTSNNVVIANDITFIVTEIIGQGGSLLGIEVINSSENEIVNNNISYIMRDNISMVVIGLSIFKSSYNLLFNNIIHVEGSDGYSLSLFGFSQWGWYAVGNKIYNNFFNSTGDVRLEDEKNILNVSLEHNKNIVSGPFIGGNFYANPTGTGFSETCADNDFNGICDAPLTHTTSNIDYLPLAKKPPVIATVQGTPKLGASINISLFDAYDPDKIYLLLLSVSGDSPGIPLGDGRFIPLNYDILTQISLLYPSVIGLKNPIGTLDNNGRSVVAWDIPVNPILAGIKFNVAFISINVNEPLPNAIKGISLPLEVTIQP